MAHNQGINNNENILCRYGDHNNCDHPKYGITNDFIVFMLLAKKIIATVFADKHRLIFNTSKLSSNLN